jgi:putative ABC transport system permease protein
MTGILQDFRFALRSLAKDRRFASLAILALALGIGSATVIFSAIYGVILNTFPFRDADQVTSFGIEDLSNPGNGRREYLSVPELLDYRDLNHVFSDISGEYGGFGSTPLIYTAGGSTFQFSADYMSANSFAFFGVRPVAGRLATPDDTKPGATPVFMMSYKLWRQQFNGDPKIVGTNFTLNGISRTLVGIMPPRFRWGWAEVWVPFPLDRGLAAADPELSKTAVWCVGRLKPGVSLKSAEADLDVVAHQLAKIYPDQYPKQFTVTADRLTDRVVGPFKNLIFPLLGAVVMLLLIACSNVANLLLARATVREKEIAVRASMGASRARLTRQFFVESFVLAAAGCLSGCLLAYIGIKAVVPLIPYNVFPQEAVIELNPKVLLFSLAVTVLTTFLCGLVPAIRAIRGDLQPRLASASKGANIDTRHGAARSVLVVAEVALSIVLLIGAGLMVRTFLALSHVDLGFNPERVLTARLPLPSSYKTAQQKKAFFEQVLQRVGSLPGVTAVAESIAAPPAAQMGSVITIPGKVHTERWESTFDLVSEDYFRVLNLRLLRGRLFSSDDVVTARRIAVVNQAFVQKFFTHDDPLGKQVKFDIFDEIPDAPHGAYFEIVGVVNDQKNDGLQSETVPQAFLPPTITGDAGSIRDRGVLVSTAGDPNSLLPAIRHQIWTIDPSVALTDAGTVQSVLLRDSYANPRFEFVTMGAFAGIGMLLVVIGIFSVMAYTVSLRTHEIGVRMALGAQRSDVLRMVLGRGSMLIGVGIAIGLLASFGLTRYLANQVWGISVTDPWTYCIVVVGVIAVGVAACLSPARRASKVEPMTALRYE